MFTRVFVLVFPCRARKHDNKANNNSISGFSRPVTAREDTKRAINGLLSGYPRRITRFSGSQRDAPKTAICMHDLSEPDLPTSKLSERLSKCTKASVLLSSCECSLTFFQELAQARVTILCSSSFTSRAKIELHRWSHLHFCFLSKNGRSSKYGEGMALAQHADGGGRFALGTQRRKTIPVFVANVP